MTGERRHPDIELRADGSLWNLATMRAYLAEIDRRAEPPSLVRLSLTDPEIVAFEATARGRRALTPEHRDDPNRADRTPRPAWLGRVRDMTGVVG